MIHDIFQGIHDRLHASVRGMKCHHQYDGPTGWITIVTDFQLELEITIRVLMA